MDVLKKIRSATLLETLVASAIILIVFVVGSLSINNIFLSSIKKDTREFDARITELEYKSLHHIISLPYFEDSDLWDVVIENNGDEIRLTALNKNNKQETIKQLKVE
ncbi:MAG: hypothetical protein JKY22_11185 [Flavobacteriaceae bacterium]|nr:hypothetical protein [Flavobacteriaceae bacterium]